MIKIDISKFKLIVKSDEIKEKILIWLNFTLLWYMPIASINAHIISKYSLSAYYLFRYSLFLVVFSLLILSIKVIIRRLTIDSVIIFLIMVISYLTMIILRPNQLDLFINLILNSLFAFSWFVIARTIKNYTMFLIIFHKVSQLVFYSSIIYITFSGFSELGSSYSLAFGYISTIVPISSFIKILNKQTIYDYFVLILSFFVTIAMGARGPLLVLFVYFILKLIIILKDNKVEMIKIIFTLSSFFFLLFINLNTLLIKASDIFLRIGVSSRVINQLLGNRTQSLTESLGRQTLWRASWESIQSNPFFGVGIGYDREILKYVTYGRNNNIGYKYPHNFFIEITMQYGLLISAFIIFVLMIVFYKTIFKSKFTNIKEINLIYFSLGFVPLMISQSYLIRPEFYIFLATCCHALHRYNLDN